MGLGCRFRDRREGEGNVWITHVLFFFSFHWRWCHMGKSFDNSYWCAPCNVSWNISKTSGYIVRLAHCSRIHLLCSPGTGREGVDLDFRIIVICVLIMLIKVCDNFVYSQILRTILFCYLILISYFVRFKWSLWIYIF